MSTKSTKAAKAAPAAAKAAPVAPVKPDTKAADNAHAADRAAVLISINKADGALGTALVEGLRMTVKLGRTSSEEVRQHYARCNSPEVYASWFNLGNRAMSVVGEKLALEAIDKAVANGAGSAFQRAREALAAIGRTAKSAGVKELKGREAAAAVKAAVVVANKSADERKAVKSAGKVIQLPAGPGPDKRGTKSPDAATLAAAAAATGKGHREMAAFLKLASQQAQRMPEPEGRAEAHRAALAALATACEAWQVFAK